MKALTKNEILAAIQQADKKYNPTPEQVNLALGLVEKAVNSLEFQEIEQKMKALTKSEVLAAGINKDEKEAWIRIWRFYFSFFWSLDLFEILPTVRLAFGHLKGIFEGEIILEIRWIIFLIQITFHANK